MNLQGYKPTIIPRYYFTLSNAEFKEHTQRLASVQEFSLNEFGTWLQGEVDRITRDHRNVNHFNVLALRARNESIKIAARLNRAVKIVHRLKEEEATEGLRYLRKVSKTKLKRVGQEIGCTYREVLDLVSFYRDTQDMHLKIKEWNASGLPTPNTQEEFCLRMIPDNADTKTLPGMFNSVRRKDRPLLQDENEDRQDLLERMRNVASHLDNSPLPILEFPFHYDTAAYKQCWDPFVYKKIIQRKEGTLEWKRPRYMTR